MMDFSIKKQINAYQSWLDLAEKMEFGELKAINRYRFSSFVFVFSTTLFGSYIYYMHKPLMASIALFMHLFLALNILRTRAIVVDALESILNYKKLNTKVAKYLNREYSLFLVAHGKKPLSQNAIENLEVHTGRFVGKQMSRGGRSDSIRRFRIAFLKKEKRFYDYLFGVLLGLELFITL